MSSKQLATLKAIVNPLYKVYLEPALELWSQNLKKPVPTSAGKFNCSLTRIFKSRILDAIVIETTEPGEKTLEVDVGDLVEP